MTPDPSALTTTIALGAIVALAFTIEAALGFGATVVAVAVGALLLPIDALLPVVVPLNMVLSASIVLRHRRLVDVRLWLRAVAFMIVGLPAGMLAARAVDAHRLVNAFGVVVVALGALSLAKVASPSKAASNVALIAAGVVHGAFGTGGPLAVFALGHEVRADDDASKSRFRATLAALWITLNVALVSGFAIDGRLDAHSALKSVSIAPAVAVGLVCGEILHCRIPVARFRVAVWIALVLVGIALAAR